MTCNVFKTEPMTIRESLIAMGKTPAEMAEIEALPPHPLAYDLDETLPGGESLFMCGEGLIVPVCRCSHAADWLCDYPIGDGKTCDLPLCNGCRHRIGADHDLCAIHAHEFKGKASTFQPWAKERSGA